MGCPCQIFCLAERRTDIVQTYPRFWRKVADLCEIMSLKSTQYDVASHITSARKAVHRPMKMVFCVGAAQEERLTWLSELKILGRRKDQHVEDREQILVNRGWGFMEQNYRLRVRDRSVWQREGYLYALMRCTKHAVIDGLFSLHAYPRVSFARETNTLTFSLYFFAL